MQTKAISGEFSANMDTQPSLKDTNEVNLSPIWEETTKLLLVLIFLLAKAGERSSKRCFLERQLWKNAAGELL